MLSSRLVSVHFKQRLDAQPVKSVSDNYLECDFKKMSSVILIYLLK